MTNKFEKNKSILMVIWQDAAFSNREKLPLKMPSSQITFGLFLGETAKAINLGMNCHWDYSHKTVIDCQDTFLIPKKVIKQINNLGDLNVKAK